MTIINNLKKTINPKIWTNMVRNPFGITTAGGFVTGEYSPYIPENDLYFYFHSAANIVRYSASENSHLQIPASGIAGTFGVGACGETMSYGCPGGELVLTATAGTTTSITTNKTFMKNCIGSKIKIVEGPNAGNEYTIAYNGIGINATIVLQETAPLAFTAATKFHIMTGSVWLFCPSVTLSGFSVYDVATNAWTQKVVTPIAAFGVEGQLMKQHNAFDNFATGSVASAATTSITVNGLTGSGWDYTNYEVEIVSGTGAGQFRRITAGTTNTFTLASAWTVIPDTTSVYVVKGDRTALYLMGNGSVNTYKYDIIANTWTLLAPTVARGGAFASGGTADIIKDVSAWNTPIVATGKIGGQNGRFIYCFRGGASSVLDIYDISTNKWINPYYGGSFIGIDAGACAVSDCGTIYIMAAATGRYYQFDVVNNILKPFCHNAISQSTIVNGDKCFVVKVKDGTTTINYLYTYLHSFDLLQRMQII